MSRIHAAVRSFLTAGLIAAVLGGFGVEARAQERAVGSNIDARTILSFKVAPASLAPWVPAGWELSPPASGPTAGANVQVTFADQLAASNAAGAPGAPVRYVLFAMPVRKVGSDAAHLMIFNGLSPAGAGPYGTNAKASEDVRRSAQYRAGEALIVESWEFKADGGAAVSMQAQFVRGAIAREKSEARVYSQMKPEFSRIYRYEQGVDLVKGAGLASDRLQKLSMKVTGDPLARIFDGSEQLVTVNSIPWYTRDIFLPTP